MIFTLKVTSPGKALLGGASANYGFETSFSYEHGWGGEESITRGHIQKNNFSMSFGLSLAILLALSKTVAVLQKYA